MAMVLSLLDIPSEILQHIAFLATLGSPLGPPKELRTCMLTCRRYYDILSPKNAGELYRLVFCQKFDIIAPRYRLGLDVVRELAYSEMRRRFEALQIFKTRSLHHPELTSALWIAYVMVEDADTSQKNVKQLLRAGLPSFLDCYLRERLYDTADSDKWPIINETTSLAIALAWTLASQVVLRSESTESRNQMIDLLAPIVFSTRYPPCFLHRTAFAFGANTDPAAVPLSDHNQTEYPTVTFPPTDIVYFGTVRRKARVPSATIFSTLLYFVRSEIPNNVVALPRGHQMYNTREEMNISGRIGPSIEDIINFNRYCGTRFADFPGIDVGILSSTMAGSPDIILCQPSAYKLGTLTGRWHGSLIFPEMKSAYIKDHITTKNPVYLTLEEHFVCDAAATVPINTSERGFFSAWLPEDLEAVQTSQGMMFRNADNTYSTVYETFQPGHTDPTHSVRGRKIVDIIITGKTDDQYIAAWGNRYPSKVLGRVRLHDGLMVLHRFNQQVGTKTDMQILQGYVTSSQNLVGRIPPTWLTEENRHYEGVFSLSRNHTGLETGRSDRRQAW